MADYTYNDKDLKMPVLSEKFSSRIGDGSGHHEEAFHAMTLLLAHALSRGSAADIGCGMGRTTQALAPIMNEVVALEPDTLRYEYTRDLVNTHHNVTVLNETTGDYISRHPETHFDLVILGMVVQHLPTYITTAIMDDILSLTKTGGLAVVSTTHALEKARCFSYQNIAQGQPRPRISEDEFNRYAADTQSQDKGLPVRRFSRSEFESIVPSGFEIISWGQYSYCRPEYLDYFAWLDGVAPHELADVGNSQYLVLKRR
ncbi:MAG: methyltransferase domain-containing protein [Halioglobus sp.]|nr:methyltransferase domain-containing protein [Halioglobus sp.]